MTLQGVLPVTASVLIVVPFLVNSEPPEAQAPCIPFPVLSDFCDSAHPVHRMKDASDALNGARLSPNAQQTPKVISLTGSSDGTYLYLRAPSTARMPGFETTVFSIPQTVTLAAALQKQTR